MIMAIGPNRVTNNPCVCHVAGTVVMSSLSAARLFSVAGKVAIVTGGGRGIGAMIASALVQNGARVYVSSRRVEACAAVAADLNKNGPGTCIALGHVRLARDVFMRV